MARLHSRRRLTATTAVLAAAAQLVAYMAVGNRVDGFAATVPPPDDGGFRRLHCRLVGRWHRRRRAHPVLRAGAVPGRLSARCYRGQHRHPLRDRGHHADLERFAGRSREGLGIGVTIRTSAVAVRQRANQPNFNNQVTATEVLRIVIGVAETARFREQAKDIEMAYVLRSWLSHLVTSVGRRDGAMILGAVLH